MIDQDHKQAAIAIGGTAVGHGVKCLFDYFGHVDWAMLANIATFVFAVMQAGLLVPKYVAWFKGKWKARK